MVSMQRSVNLMVTHINPSVIPKLSFVAYHQPMADIKDRIKEAISVFRSQRAAAGELGVEPQSVTKWLKTGVISLEKLALLSEKTNFSLDYLVTGKGNKHRVAYQPDNAMNTLERCFSPRALPLVHAILEADLNKTLSEELVAAVSVIISSTNTQAKQTAISTERTQKTMTKLKAKAEEQPPVGVDKNRH